MYIGKHKGFSARTALLLKAALLAATLFVLLTFSREATTGSESNNPYSQSQVRRMMAYHGALLARFDGRQWRFLSGDKWIRIENAGALEHALSAQAGRSSDN